MRLRSTVHPNPNPPPSVPPPIGRSSPTSLNPENLTLDARSIGMGPTNRSMFPSSWITSARLSISYFVGIFSGHRLPISLAGIVSLWFSSSDPSYFPSLFPAIFPSASLFSLSLSLEANCIVDIMFRFPNSLVEVAKQTNNPPHATLTPPPHIPPQSTYIYQLMYVPYVASRLKSQSSIMHQISSGDPKKFLKSWRGRRSSQ